MIGINWFLFSVGIVGKMFEDQLVRVKDDYQLSLSANQIGSKNLKNNIEPKKRTKRKHCFNMENRIKMKTAIRWMGKDENRMKPTEGQ